MVKLLFPDKVSRFFLLVIIPNLFSGIQNFSLESWRNLIGVVPQDPILFNGTIASNIAIGNPSASRAEIEDAARLANCEFIWGMPHGFDTDGGKISILFFYNILTSIFSWETYTQWRPASKIGYSPCACEKTFDPCVG